jgi:hypothetical protein
LYPLQQVGNANFQYALQQLPDMVYPWTTSFHLNVTNATLPGYPCVVPVLLLNDSTISVCLISMPGLPAVACTGPQFVCLPTS